MKTETMMLLFNFKVPNKIKSVRRTKVQIFPVCNEQLELNCIAILKLSEIFLGCPRRTLRKFSEYTRNFM